MPIKKRVMVSGMRFSQTESCLGECAFRTRVRLMGMFLSKQCRIKGNVPIKTLVKSHGWGNVPITKKVRVMGNVPSKIESLLGKRAFKKRVIVRGMCLQKESQGSGSVPSKKESHC